MALEEEEDKHEKQQQINRMETPQPSPQSVPTEMIVEILLRLPVDSLLRCRSVCKLWCSLISDPHFVKSHLLFSTSNNRHRLIFKTETSLHRLVYDAGTRINYKTCNPYDVLHDNSIKASTIVSPLGQSGNYVSIVGSCNGLLCMAMEEDALFIWNPSTRKSNRVPYHGHETRLHCYVRYGFGYDEYTDDHKVVKLYCKDEVRAKHETFVQIFSFKNGSWKKLGAFPHDLLFYGNGKYSNGSLHWEASKDLRSSCSWTIVSLDLANETYGEVLQPVYDEGDKDLTLGSLREGLCVLCNHGRVRADLWVMKVYGVRDSWTKLVSIPYLIDSGMYYFSVPLCISNDGNFLLQSNLKLFRYDSKNSSFSEMQNIDGCLQPCTFVESLVSPDAPADLGDRF